MSGRSKVLDKATAPIKTPTASLVWALILLGFRNEISRDAKLRRIRVMLRNLRFMEHSR